MLIPQSLPYVSFRRVIEEMNLPFSRKWLEEWDWFDLPFPKNDEVVMLDSDFVRDSLIKVLKGEVGLSCTHELYMAVGLSPRGTVVYGKQDDDTDDYKFRVKLTDGSLSEVFWENEVHSMLLFVIRDRWNTVVGPHTPIYILLDTYR